MSRIARFFDWASRNTYGRITSNYPGRTDERPLSEEKVSAGPRGVQLPWFLPFMAEDSGETSTMRLWYRRMLADPVVKAAVFSKLLGVAALELKILPEKGYKKKGKSYRLDAERQADFVDYCLNTRVKGVGPHLVWTVAAPALVDGYSVSEKVWTVETEGDWRLSWVLKELKSKDAGSGNDLALLTDEYRNVTGVRGLRYNAGEEYSPRNFLIYAHLPFWNAPTGTADLRAVYGRWWFLDTIMKWRASGIEKRAYGMLKGEYQTVSQKPSLEQALTNAKWANWMSVPKGTQIEVLDLMQRGDDVIQNAIRDLKEDIFLGIQFATLQSLVGGPGQQRGDTKTHKDSADLAKWYLAQAVMSVLNDREQGLIHDLIAVNFKQRTYPHAVLTGVDDAELSESLTIDTGLKNIGFRLSADEIGERYGRKQAESPDDELQQAQQPGGGMPGMGAGPGKQPEGLELPKLQETSIYGDGATTSGVVARFAEIRRRLGEEDSALAIRAAARLLEPRRVQEQPVATPPPAPVPAPVIHNHVTIPPMQQPAGQQPIRVHLPGPAGSQTTTRQRWERGADGVLRTVAQESEVAAAAFAEGWHGDRDLIVHPPAMQELHVTVPPLLPVRTVTTERLVQVTRDEHGLLIAAQKEIDTRPVEE